MKFTQTHEWIKVQDNIGTVGISSYAQQELGDIVYVELPKIGKSVKAGDEAAVLESTKAAADVYSPVSGLILEINENLKNDASLINSSAEKEGWLFKIKLSDPKELDALMDEPGYLKMFRNA
jgi:glycine cleavage system H protein